MSVMIKDMEMPTNCTRCPCSDDDARFCKAANAYIPMLGKPKFCPLAEVEPQRMKGRWIHDGCDIPHGVDWMHCSICGKKGINVPADLTNFCPNCGADMRGEAE